MDAAQRDASLDNVGDGVGEHDHGEAQDVEEGQGGKDARCRELLAHEDDASKGAQGHEQGDAIPKDTNELVHQLAVYGRGVSRGDTGGDGRRRDCTW